MNVTLITPVLPAGQSVGNHVQTRVGGVAAFEEEMKHTGASAVLLDSYRQKDELIASVAGCPVAMFDDHYRVPTGISLVINASPAAKVDRYKHAPLTLLGPVYASLNAAFRNARGNFRVREKVGKVMVALGGNDTEGQLPFVTEALLENLDGAVLAVCGAPEAKIAENSRVIRQPWLGQETIAELMSDCDLAVLAGGQMLVQAACVGLPAIAWPQTQNQAAHARSWEEMGSTIVVDELAALPAAVANISAVEHRSQMSQSGQRVVDGLGAGRIADKLLELVHGAH